MATIETFLLEPQGTTGIVHAIDLSNWTGFQTEPPLSEYEMSSHERFLIDDQLVWLDAEFASYIRYEAAQRGVTKAVIYREEMEARAKIDSINPSVDDWLAMAQGSGAPEYMKDESGGPCPF